MSERTNIQKLDLTQEQIISDYKTAFMSRQASLIGRKEVLTGKAKFGIFGDGKEIAQIAMAHSFKKGDWRSGYYRDQTLMFALGISDVKKFFAQLFADCNVENDPSSAGRQMNSHFATRYIDNKGNWLSQLDTYNSSADLSPTACQMGRAVGLAYASKLYKNIPELKKNERSKKFSNDGQEICFATIGNASTSEGIFWESINAAGVLQIPLVISVWDDDYGISVHNKYQTTKENISDLLHGFNPDERPGVDIYVLKGWDYPGLVAGYKKAVEKTRKNQTPALIHVIEVTQPQGHSTSGSHERYKSKERLSYEETNDGLRKMRAWMIAEKIISEKELSQLESDALKEVELKKNEAWDEYLNPIKKERDEAIAFLEKTDEESLVTLSQELKRNPSINRKAIDSTLRRAAILNGDKAVQIYSRNYHEKYQNLYSAYQFCKVENSCFVAPTTLPIYSSKPETIDGRQIIQKYFEDLLSKDPRVFIVGEDVGQLGGVNLEFEGLQEKFGETRVTDTGIREATILGQGLGAAMRGLRPIVDIQYLDYLLYCFQLISDDLVTLSYRSAGGQLAPVIIRTKGHRLEGIWHTGSPMGTIIHGARGMHICVPRNMTQAVGFYNTLLKGDDPALVIEVLNGYRVKEPVPENLTAMCLPLGTPEVLIDGKDLTLVTYGASVRVAQEACEFLKKNFGAEIELIDVQTLLPYDLSGMIAQSIKKTNLVLFLDEDVPGGASAYMMEQTLVRDKGFDDLDGRPMCLSAKPHRSAYASDGDYYSKPSVEDIVETILSMLQERQPSRF